MKSSQRPYAMFLCVVILLIVQISIVSAWSFDNVEDSMTTTFDGKDIKDYLLLQEYSPIKISNAFDLPIIGYTIFEGYLSQHTETCGIDCSSTMEIKLYEERPLIDEVEFKTLQSDGKWIQQNVRSYQFKYLGIIEVYETQCTKEIEKIYPNGTKYIFQECSEVYIGPQEGWINYELGTVMSEGIYTIKLEAEKRPSRTVDWIIKTGGIKIISWATWGNITTGDDAEVILNSPVDEYTFLTNTQTFNCSANVTGGLFLTNISLWTNESGTWESKNSTDVEVNAGGLIAYYSFEESAGDAIDSIGDYDLTNNGATYEATGKIGNAYNFDGGTDYLNVTISESFSAITVAGWYNGTTDMDNYGGIISFDSTELYIRRNNVEDDIMYTMAGRSTLAPTENSLDGGWHFFVFTWNDTSDTGCLWVDNNLLGCDTGGDGTLDVTQLEIGRNEQSDDYNWNGSIDELSIWNVVLNDSSRSTLYNSGSGSRPGIASTSNITETWDRTLTDNILWSCQACDSDGDCGFATENRTLLIDTTSPTSSIQSPKGTLDYGIIGGTETLNITFTDTNLDTCWYNYNGTNITINGCVSEIKNSTTFILGEGNYNIITFGNDSVGNLNTTFYDWDYTLIEIFQTYPETSVESATETYIVNLTYDSSTFGVITGYLTLNGTEYTGTRTGSGDSAIFTTDAIMPSIDSETNFTAYWTISLTDITDTTDYNLTSHNVTVSIINFGLCDGILTVPFWNFTILNESNVAEINSTFEGTFTITPTGSTSENVFSYSDTTGTNSTFDFCISPSTESYTVSTNIKLTKTGFVDKFYNYEEIVLTSTTREDNLYMLASDDSTSFIVHVVDVSATDIEEAEVRVQRYYPGTDSWVTTEILTTNYIGEAVGHLLSEDADYRFHIYQSGVSVYNSSATKITCAITPCTVTLTIPIEVLTGVEVVGDLDTTLTFSDTTNVFTYTYSDSSGTFTRSRLKVIRVWPSNSSQIMPCNETKTTSSGVITCDISGQINGTYRASGYITRDVAEFLTNRISGNIGINIYNAIGIDGILWSFFIFIGIIMIGISRPSLAIIFGAVGVIILSLLQLINIGAISIVSISAIAIILLMRVGRE